MKNFLVYTAYVIAAIVALELVMMIVKGIRGPSKNPWTGGNGCNLFNSTKRLPCCTAHDRAYKEGGWMIARLKADVALFRCIWKHDKVLSVVMFIGARIGSWAFQYGKKRKIEEIV